MVSGAKTLASWTVRQSIIVDVVAGMKGSGMCTLVHVLVVYLTDLSVAYR